jgi:hypothetical protein
MFSTFLQSIIWTSTLKTESCHVDEDHLEPEVGQAEPVGQGAVVVEHDVDGLHGQVPENRAPAGTEYWYFYQGYFDESISHNENHIISINKTIIALMYLFRNAYFENIVFVISMLRFNRF